MNTQTPIMNLRAAQVVSHSAPVVAGLATEVYFAPSFTTGQGQVVNKAHLTLKRGMFQNHQIFLKDAIAIVESIDLIKEFVAQNLEEIKAGDADYLANIANGTYAARIASGQAKEKKPNGTRVR